MDSSSSGAPVAPSGGYEPGRTPNTPWPVVTAITLVLLVTIAAFLTGVSFLLGGEELDVIDDGLFQIFRGWFWLGGFLLLAHSVLNAVLCMHLYNGTEGARRIVVGLSVAWGLAWLASTFTTQSGQYTNLVMIGICAAIVWVLAARPESRAYFQ